VRVEEQAQGSLLPRRDLVFRKGVKEARTDAQLTPQRSELTAWDGALDRHQPHDRLPSAGDDHLFTITGALNEIRKLRLGRVDRDGLQDQVNLVRSRLAGQADSDSRLPRHPLNFAITSLA
jgi:hypothetical protein